MNDQTTVPFESLLEIRAGQIESFLDTLLDRHRRIGEIDRPPRLVAAMRHGLLNGGKRLRPFLVIESARMLGCETSAPIHVAAALECVHSYSLVHDDLPAMDDDDLRRGQPTVHKAYDEATAILAGDALLTLAFDVQWIGYGEIDSIANPMLPNLMMAPLGADGGAGFGWNDMTVYKFGAAWRADASPRISLRCIRATGRCGLDAYRSPEGAQRTPG